MFGYRLKLVKKDDLRDVEIFEKVVKYINQQSLDMIRYIRQIDNVDIDTQTQMMADVTGLNSFIDIYYHSKFSSPTSTFMMFNLLDDLRKCLSVLANVTAECSKLSNVCQMAKHAEETGNETFDRAEFESIYKKTVDTANQEIYRIFRQMIMDLNNINIAIEGDLFKVIMGVDLIKDYKERHKRFAKDKNLMTDFGIRYKVITNDDRKFLEKENYKNGQRSRTRTSDGGTEKTV